MAEALVPPPTVEASRFVRAQDDLDDADEQTDVPFASIMEIMFCFGRRLDREEVASIFFSVGGGHGRSLCTPRCTPTTAHATLLFSRPPSMRFTYLPPLACRVVSVCMLLCPSTTPAS